MNEKNRKKKARRERITLIVAAAVLLLLILTAVLVPTVRAARRLDRAERILREEGYNAVLRSGEGTDRSTGDEDVVGRVQAMGGPKGEEMLLLKFKDKESARKVYDAMKVQDSATKAVELRGRYLYYGTRTTYEMIK